MIHFLGLCAAKYYEIITIREQLLSPHLVLKMFLINELNVHPNTKPNPGIITSDIHLLTTMSELNICIY